MRLGGRGYCSRHDAEGRYLGMKQDGLFDENISAASSLTGKYLLEQDQSLLPSPVSSCTPLRKGP